MQTAWRLFKKHLTAIIFYMIYLWIFINSLMREFEYKRIIKENGGKWPYGVREWDGVLLFVFAFFFFVVTCGYYAGLKNNFMHG